MPLFLGIPLIWYRDNCPCPQCRDPKSGQKLFQITELSKGLALKSVEETADTITVSFAPDDHRSVFSREWLFAKADAERSDWRSEAGKKLWLASEIGDRLPVTSWNLYKSNDAERLRLLREIDARRLCNRAEGAARRGNGARDRKNLRLRAGNELRRSLRCPRRAHAEQPRLHGSRHRSSH